MPVKKQLDAEWEPAPGAVYVDGSEVIGVAMGRVIWNDLLGVVRWCYRHTNQSSPHPGLRDNLTRWTVSTDLRAMTWIRWDFARAMWVGALGQKDGAGVRYIGKSTTDPDAEDPRAVIVEAGGFVQRTTVLSTELNRRDFPDPDPNDPNETATRDPDNVSGMEHWEKAIYLKRRGLGT